MTVVEVYRNLLDQLCPKEQAPPLCKKKDLNERSQGRGEILWHGEITTCKLVTNKTRQKQHATRQIEIIEFIVLLVHLTLFRSNSSFYYQNTFPFKQKMLLIEEDGYQGRNSYIFLLNVVVVVQRSQQKWRKNELLQNRFVQVTDRIVKAIYFCCCWIKDRRTVVKRKTWAGKSIQRNSMINCLGITKI